MNKLNEATDGMMKFNSPKEYPRFQMFDRIVRKNIGDKFIVGDAKSGTSFWDPEIGKKPGGEVAFIHYRGPKEVSVDLNLPEGHPLIDDAHVVDRETAYPNDKNDRFNYTYIINDVSTNSDIQEAARIASDILNRL